MNQKRQLSVCPYCYKEGLDTVGDALRNTTCSVCGAELRQEERWGNSGGPGGKCLDCGAILELECDESGRCFAVCSNLDCHSTDECIREFTIIKEGVIPEGVNVSEPDSWEPIDEPLNPDWMIDKEYDKNLADGDDDIDGYYTPIRDTEDAPSFEESLSRYVDEDDED